MNIYIEYVILNNFTVNAMILYLTTAITKRKRSVIRIIMSASIGMVYAVLLPYISFNFDIGIKIALSFVMVIVGIRCHNVREYIIALITFYVVTFTYGGLVIGIGNLLSTDFMNILVYPTSLTSSYMALCIIILTFFARIIVSYISRCINYNKYRYEVIISVSNVNIFAKGYLDTGNKLYNGIHPVVVIGNSIISKLPNMQNECNEYIELSTIVGKSREKLYKFDEIEIIKDGIHKNYKNIYGIRSNRQFDDYDVLLHSDM